MQILQQQRLIYILDRWEMQAKNVVADKFAPDSQWAYERSICKLSDNPAQFQSHSRLCRTGLISSDARTSTFVKSKRSLSQLLYCRNMHSGDVKYS
jgi:hypothetical protein